MIWNLVRLFYMTFGLNITNNEIVFEDDTIVPSAEEHLVLGAKTDLAGSSFPIWSKCAKSCK